MKRFRDFVQIKRIIQHRKQLQRKEIKAKDEEDALHRPQINDRSRRLGGMHYSELKNSVHTKEFSELLIKKGQQYKEKLEQRQRQHADQETTECSFNPRVNNYFVAKAEGEEKTRKCRSPLRQRDEVFEDLYHNRKQGEREVEDSRASQPQLQSERLFPFGKKEKTEKMVNDLL